MAMSQFPWLCHNLRMYGAGASTSLIQVIDFILSYFIGEVRRHY